MSAIFTRDIFALARIWDTSWSFKTLVFKTISEIVSELISLSKYILSIKKRYSWINRIILEEERHEENRTRHNMSEIAEPQPDIAIPEQQLEEQMQKPQETEEERAERLMKQEEVDSRSVYVGNVDYQSTPEQLESFFKVVGVIERITILFDKYSGLPKGYAYVEFETPESVAKAIEDLHGKEFRGRDLRITSKRTNLPGFRKRGGFRGRGRGRGRGGFRGRGRGGFRGRGRGESGDDDGRSTDGPTEPASKKE